MFFTTSHGYDEEEWRNLVEHWVVSMLFDEHYRIVQVVPQGGHAVLCYRVSWSKGNDSVMDTATLDGVKHSLKKTLGPLATVTSFERTQRQLDIGILPPPTGMYKGLDSTVNTMRRVIASNSRCPFGVYAVIFIVALMNFFAACGMLHQHWCDYEAPYKQPVAYIFYHLPFVGHWHQ